MLIVATGFEGEVISHTALHGIPYLPFVVVDYDQALLPRIPAAVEQRFDKIVKALISSTKELEEKIPGKM
ncbi:MAG: hypothetical protein V1915_02760 [Candidatus Bathyarchaeota archaeon]